jgi:hypothetical protein
MNEFPHPSCVVQMTPSRDCIIRDLNVVKAWLTWSLVSIPACDRDDLQVNSVCSRAHKAFTDYCCVLIDSVTTREVLSSS